MSRPFERLAADGVAEAVADADALEHDTNTTRLFSSTPG
jgi:hypothetical protein